MTWALVLGFAGAFLIGGALSLKSQKAHLSWVIVAWALAVACLVAAGTLAF